jgi:hypothetical protein
MKFNNIHTALTDADLITTLETANVFRFGISSRDGRPSRRPAAPTRSMLRNTTRRYRTRRSRLDGSLTRTGGRRVGRPHSHRHSGRHRINKTPRPTHTTGKKPPSCSHTDTAARRCCTCCRPALPCPTPPPRRHRQPQPATEASKHAPTTTLGRCSCRAVVMARARHIASPATGLASLFQMDRRRPW